MNCKKCGIPIGPQQGICPSCGTVVEDTSNLNNMQSVPNIPSMPMQGMNNLVTMTMPTQSNEQVMGNMNTIPNPNTQMMQGMSNSQMGGIQEPSNFNLAGDHKPINNIPNQNISPNMMASNLVNPPSNINFNQNTNNSNQTVNNTNNSNQEGMYFGDLELPDEDKSKKRIPWFFIAGVLVVIMVVGIIVVPQFNKLKLETYVGDYYDLEYNANWMVDDGRENMTLYYSDNNSKFMFNALSSFEALNSSVESEASKKDLYNQFYKAWSNLDGGELTGGTDTFLRLNDDTLYARVDYSITGEDSVGSFYVVINEKKDKVISFMTYCSSDNKKKIDKEVLSMLDSIVYKPESKRGIYNKFKAGETKAYHALGYMKYDVPSCWTYDEYRTQSVSFKSNVFQFVDETTLLDIKAGTYNTTYEQMKSKIVNSYGALKEEKKKTIKGKVWYVMVTPDYDAGGYSFHNEIYFTLSTSNKNLYYIEAYVYNDTSDKKKKYLDDSIEYIISHADLLKVNE